MKKNWGIIIFFCWIIGAIIIGIIELYNSWQDDKLKQRHREIVCQMLDVFTYKNEEEIKKSIDIEKKEINASESETLNIADRINKMSKITNVMIEVYAEAEGWRFIEQPGINFYSNKLSCDLQKTNNTNIPFLTNIKYIFQNPNDNNIFRYLIKSFIFDEFHFEWVPLSYDLYEHNININGKHKINVVRRGRLWQGDWEVPFFKNEETAKEFIINE